MGDRFKVRIESMAFGGYGLARVQGKVLFVPYTIKDEEIEAEITEEKRDFALGQLTQVHAASPWRVNPPCPYFGRCGGCQWQHIDPSLHGSLKQEILGGTLKRLGKFTEIPPIDVFPAAQPYGYRVRIQLKHHQGTFGYYEEHSHRLVPIRECLIAHPLINRIIPLLCSDSLFAEVQEIEINVSPEEHKGVLVLHPRASPPKASAIEDFIHRHPLLKGVSVERKGKYDLYGDPRLEYAVMVGPPGESKPLKLRTSPGSFFQVNPIQNERLIEIVLDHASPQKGQKGLDLYSGIGNFTLPLSQRGATMWGIEESASAVKDARFNASRNGIKNCRFILGAVEHKLGDFRGRPLDFLVLDPPRAGSKKLIDLVASLGTKRIVYVSCDPATLSRDLRLLADRGYSLQALTLIDLFPQTYHMETVALLRPPC